MVHAGIMTDYREEQEGEVEALRSIYPEEELKGKDTICYWLTTSCATL